MAVTWTEEQKKVIDTRNCDILVSAAAGSGKTAVLVARILALITDEKRPVDIDRLLVVTFTNAAAAEMRERIRDALEKRAEEEPDNAHLQRQLVLVHNAKITTIHSFCLHVLRNHFQTVGIDPSFRVADEGEMILLEQEAVEETVNRAYKSGKEEFSGFLECFATGKSDMAVQDTILQIYHVALGQPWPKEWLEGCCSMYPEEPGFGEEDPAWMEYILQDTKKILTDARYQICAALKIANEPDGPYPYTKALESDLELLEELCANRSYEEFAKAFYEMKPFARLGNKKDEGIAEEKKLLVKEIRDAVKDALASLRTQYYYDDLEILQQEFSKSGNVIRMLVQLTEDFMDRLSEKKTEKNILDFGDLEHLALQALVKREDGKDVPTAAAREYAEAFEEIMIDEYQDSNLVQELILRSVSGKGQGAHNLFMVGDVKQSIYRFRLARPELFMEKYKTYRKDGEDSCRIDLHKNFRSRAEVLHGVNFIFRQIMTEGLGGIAYDDDAALYPGADYKAAPAPSSEENEKAGPAPSPEKNEKAGPASSSEEVEVEITTLSSGAKQERDSVSRVQEKGKRTEFLLLETQEGRQKQREEALLVGRRIQEIIGKEYVWDKEEECFRKARYGDIVILLRTVSGWADTFGEVLGDMGIPCFTGSQKGYFSATEIRVVLSYLQILDNPVQDIPLAAVLRSAMGNISDEELAKIRNFSSERYFYDCCRAYCDNGPDKELKKKLEAFFKTFGYLRGKSAHTPVHLLIWELLDLTGYGAYAQSLPAGEQRRANLDMLVEKAIAYEATSYRGLYHFVRYIENLKKYEVDYGEANMGSEGDDTVRIMSIHKSKGLEFPIVFVSGLGKQFNESDARSKVVMHPEFGMACDYVDAEMRVKQPTLLKRAIQQKTSSENLGEELRILYVAMTRAKERLILTGVVGDAQDKIGKWRTAAMQEGEELSYSWLSGASTYLDWVAPTLLRSGKFSSEFSVEIIGEEEQVQEDLQERADESERLSGLLSLSSEVCYDEATRDYLDHVFSSVYPYEKDRDIIGKLSVSELKKLSHMPEEEDAKELYRTETVIPLIPEFIERKEAIFGAEKGTIYHTFMENLDYSRKDELEIQLEELISCGKMSREESTALELADVNTFLATKSGARMEKAAVSGQLFREQPFVLGVAANEIRSEWDPEETVLVQGIIDAYFIEDGQITVLDYKTDRVKQPQDLVEKYRAQLDYYALALERLTGLHVKDRIIYSFYLGRDIVL